MLCKTCDYPLWNLTARLCPECGTPFKPSDFEFTLNSVQFCCPHCRQPYYGTGDKGHLLPSAFACVTCARPIDMDEMILLPTEGVQEVQTRVDTMPWLERRNGSLLKAWWLTIWRAMTAPGRLMRATPIDSSTGAAVWFAATVNLIGLLGGMSGLLIVMLGFGRGAGGAFALSGLAITLIAAVVVSVVGLLLWGLLSHALLCLGGPRAGPLSRTYHAIAYSAGPMILTSVPCLGMYLSFVGWIWWMISATVMLKEAQRISAGRAAFAALTPPLIGALLVVGAYATLIYVSLAGVAGFKPPQPGTMPGAVATTPVPFNQQQQEVQIVLDALLKYGKDGTGQGPPHAAELLRLNFISSTALASSWSKSTESSVMIGDTTLRDFVGAGETGQRRIAQDAAAALPPDNSPYRVGDYVFTDRAIDLKTETRQLWVFIVWPDRAQNPLPPQWVWVGVANGTVQPIPGTVFIQSLRAQNRLRTSATLPPIPDPATILQATPPAPAKDQSPDLQPPIPPPSPPPGG